jgi:acyl-CoA ligase (AMP-forming) (exosortase A-associated)
MYEPASSYRINSLVSIHQLLEFVEPIFRDKTALIDGRQHCTYGQLRAEVVRIAAALAERGIGKGDRVVLYAPKSMLMVQAMLACNAMGAVFIPANVQIKAVQLGHILRDSRAVCLISTSHRLASLSTETGGSSLAMLALDRDLADAPAQAAAPRVNLTDTDPAVVLYTSGSTGQPKGVVLTQRNLMAGATSVAGYLGLLPSDVVLGILPLNFDAGLSQLTTALAAGASYVMHDYLTAAQVVKQCVLHGVTVITAVPPLWFLIAEANWSECRSVRLFANTGGHMPASLLARLRTHFTSAQPYLMYGLTEAFRSTYLDPDQCELRPGSIGKAVPNAEIRVVRPDGSECAADEPGELVHRGACVTLGYLNAPERNAERFRPWPETPEGVERTEWSVWSGDIVRRDAEGYMYFVGRSDEQLKSSGHRISPTEIETVLHACPAVVLAAVLGMEDERLGQQLVACIQVQPGFEPDRLTTYCKDHLPGYMQPHQVLVFDALPLNPNGKIDRSGLKRSARERLAALSESQA